MVADEEKGVYIPTEQLRVGIFVRLELSWFEHPFSMSSFKIKDEDQIHTIRALGLKKVLCIPKKSDRSSLNVAPPPVQPMPEGKLKAIEDVACLAKKERVERLNKERARIRECEKQYLNAANSVANINRMLFSRPKEAITEANFLIQEMVASLITERNVAVHLMNTKVHGEEVYHHSLNVMVLSMMLAKEFGYSALEIGFLALGALLHDIGKKKIPDKITKKLDPLTEAERKFAELHPTYGKDFALELGLSPEVVAVIAEHHEAVDGSGYPDGIDGNRMSPLAKIIAIINTYDNLCNHPDPRRSLTPSEALAHMFSQQRSRYDLALLQLFIRCLGVYPPGTAVQLSNEAIGMVISVSARNPLRPNVLIYDPSVPKQEAIILDLEDDPGISVKSSIKPSLLPREAHEYLSIKSRVTYYFDAGPDRAGK